MNGDTDSGVSLIEVLIATAVSMLALGGAVGLLATSARAVTESELETTAIWVASRTIEEWRSQPVLQLDGQLVLDRDGAPAVGAGLLEVSWMARPEAGGAASWRVTATVTSRRLRTAVTAEAVVQKVVP